MNAELAERYRMRGIILDRMREIPHLDPSGEHHHAFGDWVLDHFRVRRCPMLLAVSRGALEVCKLLEWHTGPCHFDSSPIPERDPHLG